MAAIRHAKLFAYRLPFSHSLSFNDNLLDARSGLILQLENNLNQLSLGEIAPLQGFSHETLEQAAEQIISLLNRGCENLHSVESLYPSVNFGLTSALANLSYTESPIHLDMIPLLQGESSQLLNQYQDLNHPPIIKLKVARQTIQDDILLFNALTRINPNILIRCDANQAWTITQAAYFFENINTLNIDYIEEPTSDHQRNLRLATRYNISLGLDESLQNSKFTYQHDPKIKALVLKPTLIGSLKRLESFIKIAGQHQLQVHISSSFESIIGLQQLATLANRYNKKCQLSLGVDTLKYFNNTLLTDIDNVESDLLKLTCIWSD